MQSAFITTVSGRASVSRTLAASTSSFAASARTFHLSTIRREGESLANIADVVEAGPRSLTAADKEAGKERSGSLSTSRLPYGFRMPPDCKAFSPNDFTMKNRLWRNRRSAIPRTSGPKKALAIRDDVFHQLDINPLHEIHNRVLLRDYISELGRIIPRDQTRLTWKNQRRLGKAVRRAKAMGIIPIFSKGYTGGGAAAKENRVMASSADVQNLQKAAAEVDNNSIPGDSSLP